jgi:hypothetical protein
MKKIYTITTIKSIKFDEPSGSRCVGWFNKYYEAENCVLKNVCDIYECGYYPFAIIEEFFEGIYQIPDKEVWFKWENEGYVKCEKPDEAKSVCCWGMS